MVLTDSKLREIAASARKLRMEGGGEIPDRLLSALAFAAEDCAAYAQADRLLREIQAKVQE